eukprot:TRINITY_DN7667_c0_g1_i2.p1 TRINITY_DN7667_c0_g1~~TRINITY_DN7667_c0_g1_i2.p1  ORF type:complete len:184 (+),score=42.75 TRINITY_DN7667_c0_g1_i2:61-552(+)
MCIRDRYQRRVHGDEEYAKLKFENADEMILIGTFLENVCPEANLETESGSNIVLRVTSAVYEGPAPHSTPFYDPIKSLAIVVDKLAIVATRWMNLCSNKLIRAKPSADFTKNPKKSGVNQSFAGEERNTEDNLFADITSLRKEIKQYLKIHLEVSKALNNPSK